ncbi:MAG: hypothetical protein RLZZ352_2890 [Pseudomonadota bacterium]
MRNTWLIAAAYSEAIPKRSRGLQLENTMTYLHTSTTDDLRAVQCRSFLATPRWARHAVALAAGSVCLALSACGGGSDDDSTTTSLSDTEVASLAADSNQVASESLDTVDVLLAGATATDTSDMQNPQGMKSISELGSVTNRTTSDMQNPQGMLTAPLVRMSLAVNTTGDSATAAKPDPIVTTLTKDVPCPGGGSLQVDVTGTLASLANPGPDVDEIYEFQFINCSGWGTGVVDGQARLVFSTASVSSASTTYAGTWSTTGLTATGSRASLSSTGSGSFERNISTASTADTTLTTRVVANALSNTITVTGKPPRTLATSGLDMTSTVVRNSSGSVTSVAYSGQHTTTGSTGLGYTMATQGTVQTSEACPVNGRWSLTLNPQKTQIAVLVGAGSATLTVDQGIDASVEYSRTVAINDLCE